MEELVWTDGEGNITGYGGKMETHRLGRLHLAFSLFVLDPASGLLLLQRRAEGKYHSGGLWSNSCCSHPRRGETLPCAAGRAMEEELGLRSAFRDPVPPEDAAPGPDTLVRCGRFQYFARLGDLSEHELDTVLLCFRSSAEPVPFRREEVSGVRWISPGELEEELAQDPGRFSAWLPQAFGLFRAALPRLPDSLKLR